MNCLPLANAETVVLVAVVCLWPKMKQAVFISERRVGFVHRRFFFLSQIPSPNGCIMSHRQLFWSWPRFQASPDCSSLPFHFHVYTEPKTKNKNQGRPRNEASLVFLFPQLLFICFDFRVLLTDFASFKPTLLPAVSGLVLLGCTLSWSVHSQQHWSLKPSLISLL